MAIKNGEVSQTSTEKKNEYMGKPLTNLKCTLCDQDIYCCIKPYIDKAQ